MTKYSDKVIRTVQINSWKNYNAGDFYHLCVVGAIGNCVTDIIKLGG